MSVYGLSPEDTPRGIDIGHEHYVRFGYNEPCSRGPSDDCSIIHDEPTLHVTFTADGTKSDKQIGQPVGAMIAHRHKNSALNSWHEGVIWFDVPDNDHHRKTVWQVHNADVANFHCEPSVLCGCGDHGYIRNGRWEPT